VTIVDDMIKLIEAPETVRESARTAEAPQIEPTSNISTERPSGRD
jgi:hypothetical protein